MFYTALVVSNKDDSLTGILEVYVPTIMAKQKKNDANPINKTTKNKFNLLNNDIDEGSISNVKTIQMNTIPAYPHEFRSDNHGTQIIPENGDEILVYFKDDNYSVAYYMFANSYKKGNKFNYGELIDDKENAENPEKYVDHKIILKTKSDHILVFNDTVESKGILLKSGGEHKIFLSNIEDDSSITIESKKGHSLKLDDTNDGLFIKSKGDHAVILDDAEGGINMRTANGFRVTLDDKKSKMQIVTPKGIGLEFDDNSIKLRIDAQTTEVTTMQKLLLSSKNEVSLEGTAKLNAKSAQMELKADAKFALQSPMVEVKADGSCKIESSGNTEVKGQMIVLDGQMINLGNGASSQVLKGTEFLTMFNTHTHTAPPMGGPTTPPIVPLTPSVLSTNVFVK